MFGIPQGHFDCLATTFPGILSVLVTQSAHGKIPTAFFDFKALRHHESRIHNYTCTAFFLKNVNLHTPITAELTIHHGMAKLALYTESMLQTVFRGKDIEHREFEFRHQARDCRLRTHLDIRLLPRAQQQSQVARSVSLTN